MHLRGNNGSNDDLSSNGKGSMKRTVWICAHLCGRCDVYSYVSCFFLLCHVFHLAFLILSSGRYVNRFPSTAIVSPLRSNANVAVFFAMRFCCVPFSMRKVYLVSSRTSPLTPFHVGSVQVIMMMFRPMSSSFSIGVLCCVYHHLTRFGEVFFLVILIRR